MQYLLDASTLQVYIRLGETEHCTSTGCLHVSTRRIMLNCDHATSRTARSRLLPSYHASSTINDHVTEKTLQIRSFRVSDILEGRPCPEPEYIRPRASMARKPTRTVTLSQHVDESGTQPSTGETPPADTSATTQPVTGATPPVVLRYSFPLS